MTTEYLGKAIPVETELQAVRVRDIGMISYTPSVGNSTTTPLAGGATFTGTGELNGNVKVIP